MSCKPRTSFASEAAIHALTTVAHPRRAVNALVHRDYERFDAPTGDASCHARTPVVSDAAQIIEGYIAERRRERALALVKSYEYLHANDPADGRVKAPSDLQNEDRGSPVYGWFFAEVAALLGREHLALLSAFYSKKVDCTRTYTVFDTSIARRDHLVYYGTTAEAEATKNPRLRIDMGSPLEVAVEQGNVDYIYRRFNDGILPGLTDDDSTQHQTSRALAEHRAKIALPNQQTYEVGQVFDLFLTVFYLDWQARRPLIVSVRRIQLDDAGSLTWEGAEVLPGLVVIDQAGTYYDTHCEGLSFAPQMPGQPDIHIYTDRAVNLAVNHVRCDTFANVWRRTDGLWRKYAAVGCPRLGRFMARDGSQAVHFDSMAEAAAFNKLRSNKQKAEVAKMDIARLYEK